jgi:hypothetical protein
MAVKDKITLYNAHLIFRNFSGKASDFTVEGDRNFCVVFDEEQANELLSLGWPVKVKAPREGHEDEGNFCYMKVKVKFGSNPNLHPQVYRIVNGKKVRLTEATIGTLDYDALTKVDMRIRPYNYPAKGGRGPGVSAYLETMYATVEDDPLAAMYEDDGTDNFIDDAENPFE